MQISGLNISGGLQLWPNDPYYPDPYFEYTTLLLPGNGTNNGTNNTFIDGSTNNFTITRTGNTTQGTFSPFSQTGWSNYVTGSSGYLSTPNNSNLNIGSSDFTFECWVNAPSWASGIDASCFLSRWGGPGNYGYFFGYNPTNGLTFIYSTTGTAGGNVVRNYAATLNVGTWYHIAFCRSGGTTRAFVNGTQVGSSSSDNVTLYNSTALQIVGGLIDGSTFYDPYTGYISNLRMVIGTALYTSNFTPPTSALTAITNTKLLMCQNNRFLDNSSNSLTVSSSGSPSVQAFSPFNPTAIYSKSTNGGSGYFDGTGDYLTAASNTAFAIGTGQYTLELWIYFNSVTNISEFLYTGTDTGTGYLTFYYANGGLQVVATGGGGPTTGSFTFTSGQWYHVAASRDASNNQRLFVNGALIANATSTNNYTQNGFSVVKAANFNGYISGVRLVKGTAIYTSAFTPPSAPLTAIDNTSILLNFTNGQITDATSKNNLETVGDAKISTTQSKWGGSSMYFDGTGDYLITKNISTLLSFGTENFTIEAWVYMNTLPSGNGYPASYWIVGGGPVNSDTGFDIAIGSTNLQVGLSSFVSLNINVAHSMSATTWYHIAVCRSGSTLYAFKNGIQLASASVSGVTADPCLTGLAISAAEPVGATGGNFNGYINDLRITKGYARYTSNFTPPAAAFPLF